MNMITRYAELIEEVLKSEPARVAVAAAQDDAVLQACQSAYEQKLATFSLFGDQARIEAAAQKAGVSLDGMRIVHVADDLRAAMQAVEFVSTGNADIVMKGIINTGDLLRAVLDKTIGLRTGRVLSHLAMFELNGFDRLIGVTDGGMNIVPTLPQKADIIQNAAGVFQRLGVDPVKVAVLAAVETVNADMPGTIDAAALAKMADRGQLKGVVVDGPLALDNAVSEAAARHKGIVSPVAGKADILLVASNIRWSFAPGTLTATKRPIRSEWPIFPKMRPSGLVNPSIAQSEPLGFTVISMEGLPAASTYWVAICPAAARH